MLYNVLIILLGIFLLIVGAELLVRGSSNIAKRFHIPEVVIGLTIVAIGTSMPELMITINSAIQGSNELIIGNSIGSNLCNLLLILGLMAIIKPVDIQKEVKFFHLPIALASALIIYGMVFGSLTSSSGVISIGNGMVLIILFVLYIIYPIVLDRKKIAEDYRKEKNENKKENKNLLLQICFMVAGIALLKLGGDFVVDNAKIIAREAGVTEAVIGLTIVAIGTALPELVTSIVATISDSSDLGVGNLIGSTVFNSFLILGVGALISPITVADDFLNNIILLILSIALIWGFCFIPKKDKLTRPKGTVLVGLYIAYIVSLFV